MAFIPTLVELKRYQGPGRLIADWQKFQTEGIDFTLANMWNYVGHTLWGKKYRDRADTAGETPKPEKPSEGAMAYENYDGRDYSIGERLYRKIVGMAEKRGMRVMEYPLRELNEIHFWPYTIQGFEDGNEIHVASTNEYGMSASPWRKAKTILHEYLGSKYTRRGESHTENENVIRMKTDKIMSMVSDSQNPDELIEELARAA